MYFKKYVGEKIYLSPMRIEDYQIYTKWLNDESLASGLGHFAKNISELNEKELIENNCKNGNHIYAIVRLEDDMLLGNYGVELQNDAARRFHVGGFIGEVSERSKGYGTEALKLITKYAFEILNAESLNSGIYEFNKASLKSANKAGYSVAGKFRNAVFYNGKFHDEYLIEITKEDYLKSKEVK